MILNSILTSVFLFVSAAVLYITFCRLSMTNHKTFLHVRFLFWCASVIASGCLFASLVHGFIPNLGETSILVVILIGMLKTRKHWQNGVPRWHQKHKRENEWLTRQ